MRHLVLLPAGGYAWWATSWRPFTWPASVATLAGGLAAVAVGSRRRAPRLGTQQARVGFAVWAVLALAVTGWELAAFLQAPRFEHPTISSLANPVLEDHLVKAVGFLAWLAFSVDLARR